MDEEPHRDRKAEPSTLDLPDLRGVAEGFGRRHREPDRGRLRSPVANQLRLDWRSKGWIVPLVVACVMVLVVILDGTLRGSLHNPILLLGLLIKVAAFFLVTAPAMVGFLMGRSRQARREAIDTSRDSRPLDDGSLAFTILAAGAVSLLATWGAMVGTAVVVLGVAEFAFQVSPLATARWMVEVNAEALGWRDGPLAIAVLSVFSWIHLALATTVFLTGRKRMVAALVGVYGLAIGAYLALGSMPLEAISDRVVVGAWMVSGLALVGTAVAFVVARRRGLIGRWLPVASVAGLVALALVFVLPRLEQIRGFYTTGVALEQATMVLIPAVLALAIAPLALAPLALSWNPHR